MGYFVAGVFFLGLYYVWSQAKRVEVALKKAIKEYSFEPDYISNDNYIAINSVTKQVMLMTGKDFRVFESGEVSEWSCGVDYNRDSPKYYIQFRVSDLDNPNPKAWFGGNLQDRELWYARISTMYNG